MADQVKMFQMYMEDIDKTYKIENIDRIIVKGYASGLGEGRPNIDLSGNRARYVEKLFSRLNIIIPVKVEPKGERIDAPDNEDKPTDRRAELYVGIKGIARPRVTDQERLTDAVGMVSVSVYRLISERSRSRPAPPSEARPWRVSQHHIETR
jgi:hypothetical protein